MPEGPMNEAMAMTECEYAGHLAASPVLIAEIEALRAQRDELLAACREAINSGLEDMHPESVRIIRAAIAKCEAV